MAKLSKLLAGKKYNKPDKHTISQNLRADYQPVDNYEPKFKQLHKENPIEKRY